MALPLWSLKVYASNSKFRPVFVSDALSSLPSYTKDATEESSSPINPLSESSNKPALHPTVQEDSSSTSRATNVLLETKYGLRLESENLGSGSMSLKFLLVPSQSEVHQRALGEVPHDRAVQHRSHNMDLSDSSDKQDLQGADTGSLSALPYHYQLFPSPCSSFFWHDLNFPYASDCDEVPDEEIESLYPTFTSSFFEWRGMYDDAFVKQGCDRGLKREMFPDAEERLAWQLEGFFLSCWLLLQNNVQSVEYCRVSRAGYKNYQIERSTMALMIQKFWNDTDYVAVPQLLEHPGNSWRKLEESDGEQTSKGEGK